MRHIGGVLVVLVLATYWSTSDSLAQLHLLDSAGDPDEGILTVNDAATALLDQIVSSPWCQSINSRHSQLPLSGSLELPPGELRRYVSADLSADPP